MPTYSNIPPRAVSAVISGADRATLILPIDGETWPRWRYHFRSRVAAGGTVAAVLRPNSVTTNLSSKFILDGATTTNATEIQICTSDSSRRCNSDGVIWTKTGTVRQVIYRGNRSGLDFIKGGGMWNETATPITSLEFRMLAGDLLGSNFTQAWAWPEMVGYDETAPLPSFVES